MTSECALFGDGGESLELSLMTITSSFAAMAGFLVLLTMCSVSSMVGKDDLLWSVD